MSLKKGHCMRKFIVAALAAFMIVPAHADNRWVGPLLGGVVIGSILAQPRYVQPAPVYVSPPAYVPYYPGLMSPDYIHRPVYREVSVFVPECNCYRNVIVQVN